MVIALIAAGAVLGFVFTGGAIKEVPDFEIRKPITLGLQWLGLVSIALASVAGGITTALWVVSAVAVGHIIWRQKAAWVVGAFLGALMGALSGSSMGLLGANYAAMSNRSALIIGVVAVAVGIVFAPNRRVISPITKLTATIRAYTKVLRESGVKLSLAGLQARVSAVRDAARHKTVVASTKTKVKAKAPKAEAPATVATAEASPDEVILGRIRAIDVTEADEAPAEAEETEMVTTTSPSTPSDEEIIAGLEKLFES